MDFDTSVSRACDLHASLAASDGTLDASGTPWCAASIDRLAAGG